MDLLEFARHYGPPETDYRDAALHPLAGDAGFRRYYRLDSRPALMLVDSPPDKERNLEYVRVNDFLNSRGVRVPHMHAVSFEQGVLVLEDLGEQLLQDALTANNAGQLYGQALDMLLQMQSAERPGWIEDYCAEQLRTEMQLFPEWFCEQLLGLKLDADDRALLEGTFDELIENALLQPQVFVHRDYHSRNLMLPAVDELATIDFQDAVWGPVSYDLVSLCKDCYLRWPQARVDAVVAEYGERLVDAGILDAQRRDTFAWDVDLMGLQRHLKVLGIFARLHLRDNKPRYLEDLPLVLRYTLEATGKYAELADLHRWLLQRVIPAAADQPWYRDWQSAGRSLDF